MKKCFQQKGFEKQEKEEEQRLQIENCQLFRKSLSQYKNTFIPTPKIEIRKRILARQLLVTTKTNWMKKALSRFIELNVDVNTVDVRQFFAPND